MKSYLNSLNERERWTLIGGILCVVLYCYYLFLYEPFANKIRLKSTQLIEKTATLAWMEQVRLTHRAAPTKKAISHTQLLTLLAKQLKEANSLKFPYQLQQTSSGDIQLTFDEVPFGALIAWLMELNQNYALAIKQFDASKLDTAGMVKLTMLISAQS